MALSFTGNTGHRSDHGSDSSLDDLSTPMVGCWFNLTAFNQSNNWFPYILSKRTDGVSGFWHLEVEHNTFGGSPTYRVTFERVYDGTNLVARAVDNTLVPGTWQYIVGVDGGAGVAPKLYIGDLTTLAAEVSYQTQNTPTGALTTDAGGSVLVGNRDRATPADAFNGSIAWASVINQTPTLGDVLRQQFNTVKWTANDNLNAHLGYNGTGTQPDLSGSGNAGTVTGATVADHVPLPPQWGYDAGYPFPVAAVAGGVEILRRRIEGY